MLSELGIQDFAIIDRLVIRFSPGFNVLTGETGAGKSIIIDAVGLLMGNRADSEMIRTGAEGARIQGLFELSPRTRERLAPLCSEYGLDLEEDILVLSREINASGRNICRVNGVATTLAILKQISQQLVDIHGQGDNQSLLRARQHVELLDRYAGLSPQRAALTEQVRLLHRTRQEKAALARSERETARRIDLLQYQIAEIGAADLRSGEEEELLKERGRLANAERLITQAAKAYEMLNGGDGQSSSALDLINKALGSLMSLERLDSDLGEIRQMAEEGAVLLEEATKALREYRDALEYNPSRLEQVEERLELIHNLQRKYGDSIEQVFQYREQAMGELDEITHHEERLEALAQQEDELLRAIGKRGDALSLARAEAAGRLSKAIEAELDELRMADTRFVVDMQRVEAEDGAWVGDRRYAFDPTGLDRVEFLISPNVGEEPKSLAGIASGGETSRLMLAMKSVLSAVDETPTLIFDEIDAGIGGRVGGVVGHKLCGLAAEHQVLCVTHLPQMAAYGDVHYQVAKQVREGRTVTTVLSLDREARTRELATMLGAPDSPNTLRSAEEMLEQSAGLRQSVPLQG